MKQFRVLRRKEHRQFTQLYIIWAEDLRQAKKAFARDLILELNSPEKTNTILIDEEKAKELESKGELRRFNYALPGIYCTTTGNLILSLKTTETGLSRFELDSYIYRVEEKTTTEAEKENNL